MTIEEYIRNPLSAGKPSAVMNNIIREGMKTSYNTRFDNILMRENGEIKYYLYKEDKKNTFYIYLKIPSEVVNKFYYDVVFKFFTTASAPDAGRSLNRYDMQVFSNDPAFVYTYAYVFAKKDLVIKDLYPKLGKTPINKAPDIKNPDQSTGYIKSLYFAYIYMKKQGLFNITRFDGAQEYSKSSILRMVEDADIKISKREEEGKKEAKHKKILVDAQAAKVLSHNKILQQNGGMENIVVNTNKVKTAKKIGAVNSAVKHTKVVKKK